MHKFPNTILCEFNRRKYLMYLIYFIYIIDFIKNICVINIYTKMNFLIKNKFIYFIYVTKDNVNYLFIIFALFLNFSVCLMSL